MSTELEARLEHLLRESTVHGRIQVKDIVYLDREAVIQFTDALRPAGEKDREFRGWKPKTHDEVESFVRAWRASVFMPRDEVRYGVLPPKTFAERLAESEERLASLSLYVGPPLFDVATTSWETWETHEDDPTSLEEVIIGGATLAAPVPPDDSGTWEPVSAFGGRRTVCLWKRRRVM